MKNELVSQPEKPFAHMVVSTFGTGWLERVRDLLRRTNPISTF